MPASPLLQPLDTAEAVHELGTKAVNLGRLLREGLPVPGGVVIPDSQLQIHLERCGIARDVGLLLDSLGHIGIDELRSAARRIREQVIGGELESGLRDELRRRHAGDWQDRTLVVRSSAVAEDTLKASFAGQLDTFLGIRSLPDLELAIRRTWASLWSDRALLYARQKGLRPRHMGVILQQQAEASVSGVLFTRDPADPGGEWMRAEYCRGLGEALVSGHITPDGLRIRRRDCELADDGRHALAPEISPAEIRGLKAIARMALALEQRLGIPQDVEWSLDGDGAPILLQTRPISAVAQSAGAGPARVHWSNANIAENFPDPVCPFLYSFVRPGYAAYFRNLALGFGLSRARVAAMDEALEDLVGLHGGRLYYNLTNIHAVLRLAPGGAWLVRAFNLFVGAEDVPQRKLPELGRLGRLAEALRIPAKTGWQFLWIRQRLRRFERRVERYAESTRPDGLASKTDDALGQDLRGFLDIRLGQWNDAALADTAAMVCYGLLKAFLARHVAPGAGEVTLHNDLLKGLPGLASAEPVIRLWVLASQLREDQLLAGRFTSRPIEETVAEWDEPCWQRFRDAFGSYVDLWGFRSSAELMLTTPTPRENPLPVLRLLQAYLRESSADPAAVSRAQAADREARTAEVAARLTPSTLLRTLSPLCRARRFLLLLGATQGAIRLRERARMKQALLYTRLRHVALEIGKRLAQRGAISERNDVFYLSVQEVSDLLAGTALDREALPTTLRDRRAELEACREYTPPDRIVLDPGERWSPTGHSSWKDGSACGGVLRGNSACGGVATGQAAVVLDVSEADRLQAGQILVTRQTDPGWAAVFFLTGGLVIERGGMLSHGAIIAREYGIPAVVGVRDATRLIRDGDLLRVDGDHGTVHLVPG